MTARWKALHNERINGFKDCASVAGDVCGFTLGKMLRQFGLKDFLENALTENDDAPTIAVKAIGFFCEEVDTSLDVFKFGVLVTACFLNEHVAGRRPGQVPAQAMKDLVDLLKSGCNEEQLRRWIASHFE
jgi:hypothetical protein